VVVIPVEKKFNEEAKLYHCNYLPILTLPPPSLSASPTASVSLWKNVTKITCLFVLMSALLVINMLCHPGQHKKYRDKNKINRIIMHSSLKLSQVCYFYEVVQNAIFSYHYFFYNFFLDELSNQLKCLCTIILLF